VFFCAQELWLNVQAAIFFSAVNYQYSSLVWWQYNYNAGEKEIPCSLVVIMMVDGFPLPSTFFACDSVIADTVVSADSGNTKI
jgi:hypothetical protein